MIWSDSPAEEDRLSTISMHYIVNDNGVWKAKHCVTKHNIHIMRYTQPDMLEAMSRVLTMYFLERITAFNFPG